MQSSRGRFMLATLITLGVAACGTVATEPDAGVQRAVDRLCDPREETFSFQAPPPCDGTR